MNPCHSIGVMGDQKSRHARLGDFCKEVPRMEMGTKGGAVGLGGAVRLEFRKGVVGQGEGGSNGKKPLHGCGKRQKA